jgi:ergothioneine biosynthesis protein EgtB
MSSSEIDRAAVLAFYEKNRRRARALFDMIPDELYYSRPIGLRNPIVFYEGHLAAFNVNTLIKRAHRQRGIDERLEVLFARGIDPEAEPADSASAWPTRSEVLDYVVRADALVRAALEEAPLSGDTPHLRHGQAVLAILEHELMHDETLLYMYHRLDCASKIDPASDLLPRVDARAPLPSARRTNIAIPAGRAILGQREDHFGWDNEFAQHSVDVPAFVIDSLPVTNGEFLDFMNAGGYEERRFWSEEAWAWLQRGVRHPLFWDRDGDQWIWRGMMNRKPLELSAPVFVSHAEASAYAKWSGGRLPTEADFHRAAYGSEEDVERRYPWGDAPPDESRGNFDFRFWDPLPVGSHPAGASGVHELVGNGWEWTSTVFAPFDGFSPMASYPEYSADFFDGKHYVMKGASQATAAELLRPSFRNWFRPTYPYVYAKFRCVR